MHNFCVACTLYIHIYEVTGLITHTCTQARDILMRMMKVFIIKFKSIAEYEIADIFKRW